MTVQRPRQRPGFSWIELLLVIVILGLAGGIVVTVIARQHGPSGDDLPVVNPLLEQAMLPGVGNVRTAAARTQSQNNLHQIGIAMHNYLSAYRTFPAHAIYSQDGKPLLSWRVAILPFIEQQALYQQFKLDEPWDSEHNKKLLDKMPQLYAPVSEVAAEPNTTFYQVFTGSGAIFEGTKGIRITDIRDGTSNTILAVEAGKAVPWTKPDDVPFDAQKDLPMLGGLFTEGFNVLMADGSARFVRRGFDGATLRAAITHSGGEVFDPDKLFP